MYKYSFSITSNTPFIQKCFPFCSLTEACSIIHIYMCMLPFERKDLRPRMTKLTLSIPLYQIFRPTFVTITGEGLQIFTFTQHSWPLGREGSLAW